MRFVRCGATFGVLQRRSLDFAPGLNVVEAPNESGKSTLAAFLRTMLYGLPTRDRGALADKNRYQPWSGAPMQGTLELESEAFGAVTLTRDTARAGSPMGRFTAVRTGTGDAVPGLTAADCGELLLGVPREVYERSAFIRQSGLAIDGSAELERRIAALITTGEEGASCTEAMAALRKQLNARRANARSGRIPSLERDVAADAAALDELRALQDARSDAERDADALRRQEEALRDALRTHAIADMQEQYAARELAKRDAETAELRERQFRAMMAEMRVPPQETLSENRRRLETADELAAQLADAEQARLDAEAALRTQRAVRKPPVLRWHGVLWLILLLVCAAIAAFRLLPAATWHLVPPCVFGVLLAAEIRRGLRLRRAYADALDVLAAALRDAEALCAALKAQRERTMAQLYADVPVGDEASARAYIAENLGRYDTMAQLVQDAYAKRQLCERLPQPDLKDAPASPVTRPEQSPDALRAELARVTEQRAAARSRADIAAGRIAAIGDAPDLEASLAEKRGQLAAAQEEYDAIALAMDALEKANIALQSRFSPELGKRAATLFSAMTGGKYDAVALDRQFCARTTEAGEGVARDAALLSQGAGDQLYLAVRLAICDMVLPAGNNAPLVLDDALINFDDARCAAALELLARLAQTRQILLLTCQHREAAYLAGRENVNFISL